MSPTQAALYRELSDDLHLSWSEQELPSASARSTSIACTRTSGSSCPQLVEALLERYVRPGGRVLDPFAGSGTTLVQCLESGYDAVGVDVAAFNCLLMRVKTARHDPFQLQTDIRDVLGEEAGRHYDRVGISRSGSRRGPLPNSCTSDRSSTSTRARTCCGSSSPGRRGLHG